MQNDKNRNRTRIAVYLVGTRGNTVLLGKRTNTDHMNGYWSLIAGHAYEGEPYSNALLREVEEECGVILHKNDLRFAGVMHHNSTPFEYVNFIFQADLHNYNPCNKEPDKCEELMFFDLNNLPNPMSDYIRFIIKETCTNNHPWIAEYGWSGKT